MLGIKVPLGQSQWIMGKSGARSRRRNRKLLYCFNITINHISPGFTSNLALWFHPTILARSRPVEYVHRSLPPPLSSILYIPMFSWSFPRFLFHRGKRNAAWPSSFTYARACSAPFRILWVVYCTSGRLKCNRFGLS